MLQNNQLYIIWPKEQATIPTPQQARDNTELVFVLKTYAPHLIKEEKRLLQHQILSFVKRLTLPKDYPFKNGQQEQTKGHIVWSDFKIGTWPMLLQLLKTNSAITYEALMKHYFDADRQTPNWQAIKEHLISTGNETKAINTDELDRWYDEISATHIKPQSYHALYRWFGNDIREIGYAAFDFFMDDRNTLTAWQKAIQVHLSTITNLPKGQHDYLMSQHFNNLF